MNYPRHPNRGLVSGIALIALLGACSGPFDLDLRGGLGDALNTAPAAQNATADRPAPDARGIISYPSYQVAVAQRGDTLSGLAQRIGVDANILARYNGIQADDPLRRGEIIALPQRVSEPAGGPIQSSDVDIASIAGHAIDKADPPAIQTSTLEPAKPQSGVEPVRHQVERGETAYTIARLYNVSIRSLADWNGLGPDFHVREGQYLLIPVAKPGKQTEPFKTAQAAPVTQQPGQGSPTPTPPSAAKPLPPEDTVPAATETPVDAPDLGQTQTAAAKSRMGYPVRGDIIRPYNKGKNEGIDIAAPGGTAVKAAEKGQVAAITKDTNGAPIIVLRHADNLLTVYSNIDNVAVDKGDNVQRGEKLAEVSKGGTAAVHFELRNGFESVDPMPYLSE